MSVAALALTGCGGGGGGYSGGGGGGGPVIVTPTPTPVPTPTPTPTPTPSATFTAAAAATPTTGATLRLGKCVNMSDQLEAPNEGDWGRGIQDADITRIKDKGFTAIRLPVRFSAHALANAPYTIDATFMARVKHVVDLAVANNLAVIIDMHHYEELFADPSGHTTRFTELWRQIGVAFQGQPASVYFELINEPHDNFRASNLLTVQNPALAAVRASNPTRKVVIDGPDYASLDSMLTTTYPSDANVVPTFHYYDPANFGFDTAPWMTPATRTDFGTAQDVTDLRAVLTKLTNYMAATGRVPFAGEIGAHESKPNAARVTYYGMVTSAFASIGIQGCAWGYTNTFHLWRDATGWEPGIADAIVTTTTLPPG
ncbi:glycoside hydrolase family 5 protein [Sphingomonas caeni]|uniref:glycoside hydrolase family 5 protein n=1 Tax=Sphingomonas caeni TaxID=2984949 RepID=UPI0022309630|nr:glycoside hydrolase family 5 protein [Sphingomonas caeni]